MVIHRAQRYVFNAERARLTCAAELKANLAEIERKFTERQIWAAYVFMFFCVTGTAVFAVAQWWHV